MRIFAFLFQLCALIRLHSAPPSQEPTLQASHIINEQMKQLPILSELQTQAEITKPLRGARIVVNSWGRSEYLLAYFLASLGANVNLIIAYPMHDAESIQAALSQKGITLTNLPVSQELNRSQLLSQALSQIENWNPNLLMDFDGQLTFLLRQKNPSYLSKIKGIIISTPEAKRQFQNWQREGKSFPPVLTIRFDGQDLVATTFAPLYLQAAGYCMISKLPFVLSNKEVLVCGYGSVGKALAQAFSQAGAHVTIAECNTFHATQAICDGFSLNTVQAAAPQADMIVTATANIEVISPEELPLLKNKVVLCNMGSFPNELPIKTLMSYPSIKKANDLEEIQLPNGKSILLMAKGEALSRTSLPSKIDIADIRWTYISMLAINLWTHLANYKPNAIYGLSEDDRETLCKLFIESKQGKLTELTPRQKAYLNGELGTEP